MSHDYGFTIDCFTGEMRFLETTREDDIGQVIHYTVLQQRVIDGGNNSVWVDVPIVKE